MSQPGSRDGRFSHCPGCRPYRRGFTLIELLVVLATIGVLVALLLPAIEEVRFQARKVACLSDRRQNFISLQVFANDHDDLVPHWINDWGGTHEPDRMEPHHMDGTDGIYADTGGGNPHYLTAIGVMVAFDYVSTPDVLYCPTFGRPEDTRATYRLDQYPGYWQALRDNDGVIPDYNNHGKGEDNGTPAYPAMRAHAGIVHYFEDGRKYSRLSDYARMWKEDDQVSPMMFSCAQSNNDPWLTYKQWDTLHTVDDKISHEARGVNGVFVDGSARWVKKDELTNSYEFSYPSPHWYWFGKQDFLNNHGRSRVFQKWAKSGKFTGIAR